MKKKQVIEKKIAEGKIKAPEFRKKLKVFVEFEAVLEGSTPQSKPVKFSKNGDAEILLGVDEEYKAQVVKLLGLMGSSFKVRIEK